jgi:chemotaxis protein MotB
VAEGRRIIKKKAAAHAHHGGAWKVAYADFVTAMMALFMVMWLLASTDQQSRQEISRYFRTGILPDGDMAMQRAAQKKPSIIEDATMAAPKNGPRGEDDAKALGKAIESLVTSDPELAKLAALVSVTVTEEGVLIEAVDRDGQSMLFDLASSELKPALIAFLGKLGPLLSARGSKVRVMGHTDARPYISRTGKNNWDLSYERASNARRALEASGLMRGQIDAVQAHGASQPRNPADPYAAENRRLSFLVLNPPPKAPAGDKAPASPATPTTEPAAPAPEAPAPDAPAGPTHAAAPTDAPAAATPTAAIPVAATAAATAPPVEATPPPVHH